MPWPPTNGHPGQEAGAIHQSASLLEMAGRQIWPVWETKVVHFYYRLTKLLCLSASNPLKRNSVYFWHYTCFTPHHRVFVGNYTAQILDGVTDMAEETKIEGIVTEAKTRRSAIKTAAQVAVTAPAVGLLLSASTKTATAATLYGGDANDATPSDDPITANNNTTDLGNPSNSDTGDLGDSHTI
jgi:hypothetical protein